jgi:polyisoprenoid-binding protein YceI
MDAPAAAARQGLKLDLMRPLPAALAVVLATLPSGVPARAAPPPGNAQLPEGVQRYVIDPAASRMLVHVGKAGLFSFAGHEHQVVAPVSRGTASIERAAPERSTVGLTWQTAELRIDPRGEPAGDPPKVRAEMLGPRCLDAARYPTITFRSTAVAGNGGTRSALDLTVRGVLTLHGVSRPLALPVHVAFTNQTFTATGTASLRQSDFAIQPISVAGVVKVQDQVRISWVLVGRRTP